MFKKILIVCTGNVCRSPVGEAILKMHFQKNNLNDYHVSSAGTHALVGMPAVEHSQSVMLENGIDITQHRAQQLTSEMILNSDLILAMDKNQQIYLDKLYDYARGRIQRLGKWLDLNIEDPYKMPRLAFEEMHANINKCLDVWIKRYWIVS